MKRTLAVALSFVFFSALICAQSGTLVIRAGTVLSVSGESYSPGAILIVDGRIAAVGREVAEPDKAQVLNHPDAVVVPGFIDAGCGVGARRGLVESQRAVLADLRMADALDDTDPAVRRHLAAGITTWMLLPQEGNLLGGRAAVLSATAAGALKLLRAEAGLTVCLRESSYDREREPTSLMGALALIEGGQVAAFDTAAANDRGVLLACQSDREVAVALRLAGRAKGRALLFTTVDTGDSATAATKAFSGTVFSPVLPALSERHRAVPARYAAGGALIAFSTNAPQSPASTLRLSAVTATLGGLSQDAALRALTLSAAELLGVSDQVGSLTPGKQGDVLIFTKHPTDSRAQLLRVVQDGVVVTASAKE
ncbi:MAG: hypothetical protein EXS14_03925 [Planctomycetes bacterium]|nr:hypothetical protein [Planctomycetota bacterium]